MIEINSVAGLITVLTGIIENATNRNANINGTGETVLNGIFSFDNLPTVKTTHVLLNNTYMVYLFH